MVFSFCGFFSDFPMRDGVRLSGDIVSWPIRSWEKVLAMPMSVDALLRGSEELAFDIIRRLVCGCWSVGYAGALCARGLLIPLSLTAPGTWNYYFPPTQALRNIFHQLRHLQSFQHLSQDRVD